VRFESVFLDDVQNEFKRDHRVTLISSEKVRVSPTSELEVSSVQDDDVTSTRHLLLQGPTSVFAMHMKCTVRPPAVTWLRWIAMVVAITGPVAPVDGTVAGCLVRTWT
jgi:hypothetical protein